MTLLEMNWIFLSVRTLVLQKLLEILFCIEISVLTLDFKLPEGALVRKSVNMLPTLDSRLR